MSCFFKMYNFEIFLSLTTGPVVRLTRTWLQVLIFKARSLGWHTTILCLESVLSSRQEMPSLCWCCLQAPCSWYGQLRLHYSLAHWEPSNALWSRAAKRQNGRNYLLTVFCMWKLWWRGAAHESNPVSPEGNSARAVRLHGSETASTRVPDLSWGQLGHILWWKGAVWGTAQSSGTRWAALGSHQPECFSCWYVCSVHT